MNATQQANVDFALAILGSLAPVAGLGKNATLALGIMNAAATAMKNAQAANVDVSDADLQALFDQFERNAADDQAAQLAAGGNPAALAGDSVDRTGHGGPTLGGMIAKNPDLDPTTGLPFVKAQEPQS